MNRPPIALSIAGTDPSGGAGIHADLKAFAARGAFGTTVITALVAQNTHGVSRVYPIHDDFVADQFDAVLGDMPVDATKSGMLASRSLVELVVDRRRSGSLGFYTVDPVMVATSGHRLLEASAVDAVRELLLPVADLITPNLPEAALLLGDDVAEAASPPEMVRQARELVSRGAGAVLLKGGHAPQGDGVDVLVTGSGEVSQFIHRRVATPNTHGTGCTLSAAITAEVAKLLHQGAGNALDAGLFHEAVASALDYVSRAIESAAEWRISLQPEGAHGPVDHQVDLRRA